MYYGKKKAIIIITVIVLLLVVLTVGGVFIYLATDLFKSSQTLFLKYAADQYEQLAENATNIQLQDILTAQQQMTYETNANLTFSYQDEDGEYIEELEKAKVNIITREDKPNEKQYSNLKIDYDNNNLINLYYAKSNNIYALKWEEVILSYFVGVENTNLKEFAEKLGIQDTTNIPDEIKSIDYSDIFEVTEQEREHIVQTYINVLSENIIPAKYTKQNNMAIVKNGVNYNTTAYRLDLSAEEIRNIQLKLLATLNQDSITLNLITTKAKLLGLSEEYTTLNGLTTKIQEKINNMNAKQIDSSKGLSIVVYEYKGKTIQTEVILKNEMKITMFTDNRSNEQSINLAIDNLSEEQEYNTVNINIVKTQINNSTSISTNINIDNKQEITIAMSNVGLPSIGSVQTTASIVMQNENGENISVDYNAQTTYGSLTEDIVELNNTNCVILNEYNSQNLSNLLTAIAQRVNYVFTQKAQVLGIGTTEEATLENTVTQ